MLFFAVILKSNFTWMLSSGLILFYFSIFKLHYLLTGNLLSFLSCSSVGNMSFILCILVHRALRNLIMLCLSNFFLFMLFAPEVNWDSQIHAVIVCITFENICHYFFKYYLAPPTIKALLIIIGV